MYSCYYVCMTTTPLRFLGAQIDPALHRQVAIACAERGITVKAFLVAAVTAALKEKQT